jgi:hypothetical protein
MAEYTLYCLDGFKLIRCERYNAESDSAAIDEALRRQDSLAVELWTGARKVKQLPRKDVRRAYPTICT